MRIVVLGAGTVGTWIADLLCRHRHSVTVVDSDPVHTAQINNDLDVRAITGSVAESSVLFQADVIGADLCLAVTGVVHPARMFTNAGAQAGDRARRDRSDHAPGCRAGARTRRRTAPGTASTARAPRAC